MGMGWFVVGLVLVTFARDLEGLSEKWTKQVEMHGDDIARIRDYVLRGEGYNFAYQRLRTMSDDIGARPIGSDELENAIDHILNLLNETDKFGFITTEAFEVESCKTLEREMTVDYPRKRKLDAVAMDMSADSIGPKSSEVVVVRTFEELEIRKREVVNRVVVFNQAWIDIDQSIEYQRRGAVEAAKHGAVAVFVRSPSPSSAGRAQSGLAEYSEEVKKIPAASISVGDAEFLQRLSDRKIVPKIKFSVPVGACTPTTTRNIVVELKGDTFPDEVVMVGGHTDTFNAGDGSLDNGAGFVIAWEAVRILKTLNLKRKRSIRLVLWSAGERNGLGGSEYFELHQDEAKNMSLALESDSGVFTPRGVKVTGSNTTRDIVRHILKTYLSDLKVADVTEGGASTNTRRWIHEGEVPGCELDASGPEYFAHRRSHDDTLSVLNPADLDLASITWATLIHVVANLDSNLPRLDEEVQRSGSLGRRRPGPFFVFLAVASLFEICRND